ncbi:hypothetical protein DFQ01_103323 [Paenibacillus cellulosilyticus]|uniref:Uncharacterized protein n=1 Tax=Paenibacillus cellulosilyticus TaxID=375489 RepID=A0A2V2Z6E4_9BACL|nr:hypothetical protein [Paenibacillus cellulosilyticus]PWW06420.1 hypothetical protein DFQ01_103323 [Paenibacillus cellulosilyticus]QKS46234.1 hypothetical protein HUB94_18635 [Paenibacillus cellulosilyticus]
MIGTWRWNVGFGAVGGMMSLLFSMSGNTFAVSCVRGIYAFAVFFLLAFLFRAILRIVAMPQPSVPALHLDEQDGGYEAGSKFEAVIPDESDQLHEMLKSSPDGRPAAPNAEAAQTNQFQPLKPPQLVSTQNKDPEELAKAVRHLTGG